MRLSKEFLDEPLKGCDRPGDLRGEAGLIKDLTISLMERMLGAELTAHLDHEDGKDAPPEQSNRRDDMASQRREGQDGEVPISVPRDRDGSFEPELETRIDSMEDKIIGLCAAGLTVRDIRAHLEDVYGLQVSPDLISRITDAVLDEVQEWQSQALERMYPIVIFDALRVKIRDADCRIVKREPLRRHWFKPDGERCLRGPWRKSRRRPRGSGAVALRRIQVFAYRLTDCRQRGRQTLAFRDALVVCRANHCRPMKQAEEPGGAGRADRRR